MRILTFFAAVLLISGCYDTFTREDLGNLKNEALVIWMHDGSHYHLQQWTFDDQGNVSCVGTKCSSKSTTFDHPYENAEGFSGTIQKSSIVTVKTSSAHKSKGAVLLTVIGVLAVALAVASTIKVPSLTGP